MIIAQHLWTEDEGWDRAPRPTGLGEQLVLGFGAPAALRRSSVLEDVRRGYPEARVCWCSTAGEIAGTRVLDGALVVTAIRFGTTRVRAESVRLVEDSRSAGEALAARLLGPGLVHVLVFSDGLLANGSDLVRGMAAILPASVHITGGLSGDGERFSETLVGLDDDPESGCVVAVGFYGDRLRVGFGSLGGWDPFGPERLITRSRANVLYELDDQSALGLYKRYLGEHAAGLPASGLLFPLSLRDPDAVSGGLVRTILSVNEEDQSLTFAGDVPEGNYARLMKANFDRLIDGAHGAAQESYESVGSRPPDLAILISCVGRKLVLRQRVEEELESVREVLGPGPALAGFYSYGEISPFTPSARCELHNQTMTITTLAER